jgi:hypothetical protein
LPKKLFKVRFVDGHFLGWLTLWNSLDRAFNEGLEKAHFGHGIFFGAGENTTVEGCPRVKRGLINENLEREGGLAVGRDDIGKLAARTGAAFSAVSFEKIVLIDVAVSSRVALHAANRIWASHRRIIEGVAREVNAGVARPGDAEMEQSFRLRVPNQNKNRFKKCC